MMKDTVTNHKTAQCDTCGDSFDLPVKRGRPPKKCDRCRKKKSAKGKSAQKNGSDVLQQLTEQMGVTAVTEWAEFGREVSADVQRRKDEAMTRVTAKNRPSSNSNGSEIKSSQGVTPVTAKKAPSPNAEDIVDRSFYDAGRAQFLIENRGGRWIAHNENQFSRWLKKQGFNPKPPKNKHVSEVDEIKLEIMDVHDISYAAPLAGKMSGYYEENHVRMLVTESPRIIQPKRGDWPILRQTLFGLLLQSEEIHGDAQYETFCGWLKLAREAFLSGKFQPGQAIAIAGPRDCGKSLLQNLITEMLGGRSAKPHGFMAGKSEFNAELFEAEHLMLEDEYLGVGTKERIAFGAKIKATAVNRTHACHKKQRTPVSLTPFWRLSITLNDDPECLMVLPPLNADVADKLIILRAHQFDLPMPTGTIDEKEEFWETLVGEIPAFLHHLDRWEIPEERRDPRRYGVKTFQHPTLKESLESLSPEMRLLGLIDRALFETADQWEGKSDELHNFLDEDKRTSRDTRSLLTWTGAAGSYLGRLANKVPHRVVSLRSNKARSWRIFKDDETDDEQGGQP